MFTITKSVRDTRDYKLTVLKNGIKALLISTGSESGDHQTDDDNFDGTSAAGVAVGVGTFADPVHLQGLAHFTEHMVFRGSSRYPNVNDFDRFLQQHGGHTNGVTDLEVTHFAFDVESKYFREALERFAAFFIDSLLSESCMQQELKVVESEWAMSNMIDRTRYELLLNTMAKEGHPMAKFTWGNKKSLHDEPKDAGINVHAELKKFYRDYYVGNNIAVCIQSGESLETLEALVHEMFSPIVATRGAPKPDFTSIGNPFDTPQFNRLYMISGISHEVILTWSLPCMAAEYRKRPVGFIAWALGQKGKGSILAALNKKQYASHIEASESDTGQNWNSTWSGLTVTIILTSLGFDHIEEVIAIVFQYISMLKSTKSRQRRVFEEIRVIQETDFEWKESQSPMDYMDQLAVNMHRYPPQDYITGGQLCLDYDSELIQTCLARMTPDRMNIILKSSAFSSGLDCVEKWCETKYAVEEFDPKHVQGWSRSDFDENMLHLPEENIYLARDFQIIAPESNFTRLREIESTDSGRLHFSQNAEFEVPKAYVYIWLRTKLANRTPYHACLIDCYKQSLDHYLSDLFFLADLALTTCSIEILESGLSICFGGFSEKLFLLIRDVVHRMTTFNITPEVFEIVQDEVTYNYENDRISPEVLNEQLRRSMIGITSWTVLDKLKSLPTVDLEALVSFARDFYKGIYVEALIQGNVASQDAVQCFRDVISELDIQPLSDEEANCFFAKYCGQVPIGFSCHALLNQNGRDVNTVISNYYQYGMTTLRQRVTNDLLVSLMEEPLFTQLRAKKQLGYTVRVSAYNVFDIVGLEITVCSQATKFTVRELDNYIEEFLAQFHVTIGKLSMKEFNNRVSILIGNRGNDSSLYDQVRRYWAEIIGQTYSFDRPDRETEELNAVTLADLRSWSNFILPSWPSRRKLSTQIIGYSSSPTTDKSGRKRKRNFSSSEEDTSRPAAKRRKASTKKVTKRRTGGGGVVRRTRRKRVVTKRSYNGRKVKGRRKA